MKRSEPEQQPYHSLTMLCLPHSLLRQRSGRWKRVILHRSPLRYLARIRCGPKSQGYPAKSPPGSPLCPHNLSSEGRRTG